MTLRYFRPRLALLAMLLASGLRAGEPERVDVRHLPNAIRVHERVISGGEPDGEAAFQELARLGVKTVISVDGARPDVATARKYGIRYVHLPHGYDGIRADVAGALAKGVSELPGAVYIHCHHGKHRSPAASAVACVGAGLIEPGEALAVLKSAGTSPNYRGLYEAAEKARPIDPKTLRELRPEFPETAKLPAMAEAMVAIGHTHDHLKQLAANGWQKLVAKPDLDAPHEALLLREHYTEMLRIDEVKEQPREFIQLVEESEASARKLEEALAMWHKAGRPKDKVPSEAAQALGEVTTRCASCHKTYRDVPLSEKDE